MSSVEFDSMKQEIAVSATAAAIPLSRLSPMPLSWEKTTVMVVGLMILYHHFFPVRKQSADEPPSSCKEGARISKIRTR